MSDEVGHWFIQAQCFQNCFDYYVPKQVFADIVNNVLTDLEKKNELLVDYKIMKQITHILYCTRAAGRVERGSLTQY